MKLSQHFLALTLTAVTTSAQAIPVAWDALPGHYRSKDCEAVIEVIPGGWTGRPHLRISLTNGSDTLEFTARVAAFQQALASGHYSAGTASYVTRQKGFSFGMHAIDYAGLRFTEPQSREASEPWSLRGITLDHTEMDGPLVKDRLQLRCWNVTKIEE